jgi:iron complex outermembrane recepter protein
MLHMNWLGRAAVVTAILCSGGADGHALGPTPVADDSATTGSISGRAVDAVTGTGVAAVHVRLLELNRSHVAGEEGLFLFRNVPAGSYTIVVERLGYSPASVEVVVAAGLTAAVELQLRPSVLALPGVIVTGGGRARRAEEVYQPTAVLANAALQRALGTTVTATIQGLPGIHQQYNGPAASQPVIRGMGGDRVLVLEDGQRTGDLYNTAADHAVAIDPLTAERIEVVRGPAGLLYGSNALGGIINVIREEVPASMPDRRMGTVSLQGESAYQGMAGGGSLLMPLGRVVLRTELAARRTADTRTPLGVLESTALRGVNVASAASLMTPWGFVGVSARRYQLDHGVPGEFDGVLIPGAHPGGVEIESRRTTARLEAVHRSGLGPFSSVELSSGVVRYVHDEIEGRGPAGERWVGTHFDQLSAEGRLIARHRHLAGTLLREGALGLEYRGRDLRTGGSSPGLRAATEHALGAYLYEELGRGALRLQVGGRYDLIRVAPYHTDPIRIGRGAESREVAVSARTFGALSGSLATLWSATSAVTLGVNFARSFRAPSVRELFSDGPHLADYAFDVGNPALDAEMGHGIDVFARYGVPRLHAEAAVFVNAISGYIHHSATGDLDPRSGRFPVFQARSDDALFRGAEGRIEWQPLGAFVLDGSLSFVVADRRPSREPLPSIPPLTGSTSLRYERARGFATLGWRAAASQSRVPAPMESPVNESVIMPQQPTASYSQWHAGAGLRWTTGTRSHSVTLNLLNAFDAVWRDHLSRTKDIAPQPGRNAQLLYRVHF